VTWLTTHTLRFYEQETPVRRNAAGRRAFVPDEVAWLKVCTKLRSSGMPLPEIRQVADLQEATHLRRPLKGPQQHLDRQFRSRSAGSSAHGRGPLHVVHRAMTPANCRARSRT
jgi:DNA-binding transcriptional MerR regulator